MKATVVVSYIAAALPIVAIVALLVGYLVDYIATVLGQPVGGLLHLLVMYQRQVFALVGL